MDKEWRHNTRELSDRLYPGGKREYTSYGGSKNRNEQQRL
jgi:hypothetical protein